MMIDDKWRNHMNKNRLEKVSRTHPDQLPPICINFPGSLTEEQADVAGDRYSPQTWHHWKYPLKGHQYQRFSSFPFFTNWRHRFDSPKTVHLYVVMPFWVPFVLEFRRHLVSHFLSSQLRRPRKLACKAARFSRSSVPSAWSLSNIFASSSSKRLESLLMTFALSIFDGRYCSYVMHFRHAENHEAYKDSNPHHCSRKFSKIL